MWTDVSKIKSSHLPLLFDASESRQPTCIDARGYSLRFVMQIYLDVKSQNPSRTGDKSLTCFPFSWHLSCGHNEVPRNPLQLNV